jgi:small subunit ribosomal protein S16
MLKMRLQRVGRRNDPSYRVVVTDSRTGPKSNKHVAILGSYNPKMDHVQIDGEAAKDWISKGVQVSDTVHNILVGQKVIEGKKVNVLPKKSPIIDEEALKAEEEAKAAAEAEAAESAESDTTDSADDTEATTDEAPADDSETEAEETPQAEPAPEGSADTDTPEAEEEKKD